MSSDYVVNDIRLLDPSEPVRRRPSMYVGDTHDGTGVMNMIRELVANALDPSVLERCARIEVTTGDVIEVWDDGPGMPFDDADDPRESTAMLALTQLFADGSCEPDERARGHYGVGLAPVVFLCESFEVWSVRGDTLWRVVFAFGALSSCVSDPDVGSLTGTVVRMKPDPTIFSSRELDRAKLESRLSEMMSPTRPLRLILDGVELARSI